MSYEYNDSYDLEELIDTLNNKISKIADLEAKLAELNKEPLNCSQIENGMSLCVIQKSRIKELEAKLAESESSVKVGEFWHSAYQGKQLDYDKVYAELRQSYDENEKLKQELNKWSTEYARAYVNRQNDLVAENQQLKQQLTQCELDRKFEQEKKDIAMKRVVELKQQLADKETRIAELEDKDWYESTIKQLEEQNEKLLYKVADKDKEIATLEVMLAENKNDIKELQEFKVGDD